MAAVGGADFWQRVQRVLFRSTEPSLVAQADVLVACRSLYDEAVGAFAGLQCGRCNFNAHRTVTAYLDILDILSIIPRMISSVVTR